MPAPYQTETLTQWCSQEVTTNAPLFLGMARRVGYNTARPPGDNITKIVTNLGGNKLTAQEAGASPRLVFLR